MPGAFLAQLEDGCRLLSLGSKGVELLLRVLDRLLRGLALPSLGLNVGEGLLELRLLLGELLERGLLLLLQCGRVRGDNGGRFFVRRAIRSLPGVDAQKDPLSDVERVA